MRVVELQVDNVLDLPTYRVEMAAGLDRDRGRHLSDGWRRRHSGSEYYRKNRRERGPAHSPHGHLSSSSPLLRLAMAPYKNLTAEGLCAQMLLVKGFDSHAQGVNR
jgi:hypothetical protein